MEYTSEVRWSILAIERTSHLLYWNRESSRLLIGRLVQVDPTRVWGGDTTLLRAVQAEGLIFPYRTKQCRLISLFNPQMIVYS
jgi:hypothetical protein